jgi:competence protein ComEA
VRTPGVYKLVSDSRVSDAVTSAGGLTDEADTKRINLAAKLVDGQKLYIGKLGESVSQNIGGQIAGVSEGQININTSTQKELESLPGIGPVTAGKIIASRPYSDVGELLSRKVVGKSVYEKIRDLIATY